jgi:hypothetical protein
MRLVHACLALEVAAALLLPAGASAVTVTELAFGDLGDTFLTRTLLPAQTDEVQGSVTAVCSW